MLTHLGYPEWEDKIVAAIEDVLVSGDGLTPDLGGTAHTGDAADAVIKRL